MQSSSSRRVFPRFTRGLQLNLEDPYGFYNDGLTAEEVAGLAERLHADLVIVFARDGWGRAFYPSSIYPRHPRSRLDLARLRRLLEDRGRILIVMTNHTSNRFLYERHPGWAQRGPRGELRLLDHHPSSWKGRVEWPLICPNSPAGRLYREEAAEALDATGAQGVLLDSLRYMPDPGRACYCHWCRARFRDETGMDLPAGPCGEGEPCWEAYREAWEWRYRVTRRLVEAVAAEVHARGGWLLYNNHPGGWSGRGLRFAEELSDLLDAVFAEASEEDFRGPWWRSFIVKASWAVMGGKPVLTTRNAFPFLMPPVSAPPALLEHSIWSIVASGGSPVVTAFASTLAVDPGFVDTVSRVYEEIEGIRDLLEEREPLADVAILYSSRSHDWHMHGAPDVYIGELFGLAKGLSALHYTWWIVSARRLRGEVEQLGASTVVVADTGVAERGLEEELRGLLGEGTRVLMTGLPGVMAEDFSTRYRILLSEELGAVYEGVADVGVGYVELLGWEEPGVALAPLGAPDPLFVERRWDRGLGQVARLRLAGGRARARLVAPRAPYGYEYTLGRSSPPPGEPLWPIIVESPGYPLLYHGYRLGLHIHRLGLPVYLSLLEASLRRLGVERRVWLEDGNDMVQVEAYRVGEGLLVHLVNNCWHRVLHALPEATTPGRAPGFEPELGLYVPRRVPPCGAVTVAVRLPEGSYVVRRYPGGGEERISVRDGVARLEARLDGVHLAIHIAPAG